MKRFKYLTVFFVFGALLSSSLVSTAQTPSPKCFGSPATIVGADQPRGEVEFIEGTEGPDVIWGGKGPDVIHGNGGNDIICGGPGRDRLYGGPEHDVLLGGLGRDTIQGYGGWDVTKICKKCGTDTLENVEYSIPVGD